MATVPFDTFKLATRLEQSGFTWHQAKGFSSALVGSLTDEMVKKTYVAARLETTKPDVMRWMLVAIWVQSVIMLGTRNTRFKPTDRRDRS